LTDFARAGVTVVVEHFHPQQTGTPYLLTQLCQTWGRLGVPVRVITTVAGPPLEDCDVIRVPTRDSGARADLVRRGVEMLARAIRLVGAARRHVRRRDCLVAVAGPSIVPWLLATFARDRAARLAIVVHDVYPEAAIAAGAMSGSGLLARVWRMLTRRALRAADAIVAIGDDMATLLRRSHPGIASRLHVIPHWAEPEVIRPQERDQTRAYAELAGRPRFVVQCAGNLGRTHGVQALLDAEARLRSRFTPTELCFQFIGDGGSRNRVILASREPASLVQYLGTRPRSEQADFLSSGDLSVIAYLPSMVGTSVPSRLPGILCAGRAILAIADRSSDLARLVERERIGWVVSPADADALVAAIAEAQANPQRCREMGARARQVAMGLPNLNATAQRYLAVFDPGDGIAQPQSAVPA
jgi:colanic acid biosynthesis glycosyl transferase WcaI